MLTICPRFFILKKKARPDDYPSELLQTQFVVSFHKHWMLDPIQVYDKWFATDDQERLDSIDNRSSEDCSPVKPQECHVVVKQTEPGLFQAASHERLPDELWHILVIMVTCNKFLYISSAGIPADEVVTLFFWLSHCYILPNFGEL